MSEALDLLRESLDYAEHNSWRCEYPPHFYYVGAVDVPEGECPCGLLAWQKKVADALDEQPSTSYTNCMTPPNPKET